MTKEEDADAGPWVSGMPTMGVIGGIISSCMNDDYVYTWLRQLDV